MTYSFTPNTHCYATQTDTDYNEIIKTIRRIYCGKNLRIENGVVTALPYKAGREAKVVGTITISS